MQLKGAFSGAKTGSNSQARRRSSLPAQARSISIRDVRLGGASPASGRVMPARAANVTQATLEEVDPVTGMVIERTAASNPTAGFKVGVHGVNWAYRSSTVNQNKASVDKPVVLLIHGLGSSSWCYRTTLELLGQDGYEAYAPDWPGHGDSDKPTNFNFSQDGLISGLQGFVEAVGINKPVALVVHGYVLPQYALLWALKNESKIARLMILNTPLSVSSKLRPELAAYKNPMSFLRPKSFDGFMYNATGTAYVIEQRVVDVYAKPYAEPAASAAVASIMDKLDFGKLLKQVSEGYCTWRKPSVVLYGSSDPFMDVKGAFDFLDDKRTNMKVVTSSSKLGHCPTEDFPEAVHDIMVKWLSGASDDWSSGMQSIMKMTKRGAVEV